MRLKNIVESKKDHGHPNYNKAHLQKLVMQSLMNRKDKEDELIESNKPKVNFYSRENVQSRPGPADYNTRKEIGKDANAYTFGNHQEDPLKIKVGFHPAKVGQ